MRPVRHRKWPVVCGVALGVAVASLAGCSAKIWYAATQAAAENECRRLPPGETQPCLARVNSMSYEDYERKRSGSDP